MLGLPFNEAIDMWSLGIVMGFMMLGTLIFPWFCDYNQVSDLLNMFFPNRSGTAGLSSPRKERQVLSIPVEYFDVTLCFVSRWSLFVKSWANQQTIFWMLV